MAEGKRRKAKKTKFIMNFVTTFLVVIFVFVLAVLVFKMSGKNADDASLQEQEAPEYVVTVDGYDVAKYSQNELKNILMQKHPWALSMSMSGNTIALENPLENIIDGKLAEAYAQTQSSVYVVEMSADEKQHFIENAVSHAESAFGQKENFDSVMSYNSETGRFDFGSEAAIESVDSQALSDRLNDVLASGSYEAEVSVPMKLEHTNISAADFQKIGTYTTHTTANAARNTNVSLACKTINGVIILPGESFSYNECLGPRTGEKGYKEAGAYSNGEHVLEYGGGVCQVSSTLYNAAFAAGLQVDLRTGHTYEPTYVTPGQDATVSYSQPDFKFTNNTSAPVGILASFADRTVVVDLYGVPVLEPGVKRYMRSEKIADLDPPPPVYVESVSVVPGYENITKNAKLGSKWQTYEVLEKDGEIIKDEYLHTTSYKGEAATIEVNNSGVYISPEAAAAAAAAAAAGAQQLPDVVVDESQAQ